MRIPSRFAPILFGALLLCPRKTEDPRRNRIRTVDEPPRRSL